MNLMQFFEFNYEKKSNRVNGAGNEVTRPVIGKTRHALSPHNRVIG